MANEGRENNVNWDGIWDVATRITETGWYAEIRIPFRTLKFNDDESQTWGINFERKVRRLNEDSYWAPIPRIYDIQRVSLAGTVEGMLGVRAGQEPARQAVRARQLEHDRRERPRRSISTPASTSSTA